MKTDAAKFWRAFGGYLFAVLAAVCLISMIATRYVRDNWLNTERFVAIVAPLPQNNTVATALADYVTAQIFDNGAAEGAIKSFLPPRLDGLAAPLSSILKDKVHDISVNIVKSDQFTTIWTSTNRLAQSQLIRLADSSPRTPNKNLSEYSLKLQQGVNAVRTRLGQDTTPLVSEQARQNLQNVVINTRLRVNRFRQTVKAIRLAAATLPYVVLALVLVSLAIAYNRRRALLVIGALATLTAAIMLIVFKVGSNAAIGSINTTYQAAAHVIYEAFYSNLRLRIAAGLIVGWLILIAAMCAGPYGWAQSLRHALRIDRVPKTKVWAWAQKARAYLAQSFWWYELGGVIIYFVILLLSSNLTSQNLIISTSVLASYCSAIVLFAHLSPHRRKAV